MTDLTTYAGRVYFYSNQQVILLVLPRKYYDHFNLFFRTDMTGMTAYAGQEYFSPDWPDRLFGHHNNLF